MNFFDLFDAKLATLHNVCMTSAVKRFGAIFGVAYEAATERTVLLSVSY